MDKIELAKWLHDNYKETSKKEGWNTQENYKVEFDTFCPQCESKGEIPCSSVFMRCEKCKGRGKL